MKVEFFIGFLKYHARTLLVRFNVFLMTLISDPDELRVTLRCGGLPDLGSDHTSFGLPSIHREETRFHAALRSCLPTQDTWTTHCRL